MTRSKPPISPPYLLCLTLASQPARASLDISAPLYPLSLVGVGWERCLGSAPCAETKPIYYTSIKQRELHCCCQLNCLNPVYERCSCSACLHTCSTCCQNQISPRYVRFANVRFTNLQRKSPITLQRYYNFSIYTNPLPRVIAAYRVALYISGAISVLSCQPVKCSAPTPTANTGTAAAVCE